MEIKEIDRLVDEYRKELDKEIEKGFFKGKFDKRAMMLWGAFEMLIFLNKRGLLK